MKNYYQILELTPKAGKEEIKTAYRRLAKLYHPDTGNSVSAESFRRLHEAYQTLSDDAKRLAYDVKLLNEIAHRHTTIAAKGYAKSYYRSYKHYARYMNPHILPEYMHKPFYYVVAFLGFVMITLPLLAIARNMQLILTTVLIPAGVALVYECVKQLKLLR